MACRSVKPLNFICRLKVAVIADRITSLKDHNKLSKIKVAREQQAFFEESKKAVGGLPDLLQSNCDIKTSEFSFIRVEWMG